MRDVIEMARESWLDTYGLGKDHISFVEALERFAELVRADERKQIALDKKAENARELGLDYEPAQQEPVTFLDWYDNAHWGNEDFKDGCWRAWDAALEHTSPPAQRTWVGLTNNELQPIADEYRILFGGWVEEFARAIEAKLKEKNT